MKHCSCLIQLASYCIIYVHLYRHENTMGSILPDNVLKRRKKKHVIDLFGQVVTYGTEIAIVSTLLAGFYRWPHIGQFLAIVTLNVNFGILGVVHLVVSAQLRTELKDFLNSIFGKTSGFIQLVLHGFFTLLHGFLTLPLERPAGLLRL